MAGMDVGSNNRWEYLLFGQPVLDIAKAESAAKVGEVVLSAESHALLHPNGMIPPSPSYKFVGQEESYSEKTSDKTIHRASFTSVGGGGGAESRPATPPTSQRQRGRTFSGDVSNNGSNSNSNSPDKQYFADRASNRVLQSLSPLKISAAPAHNNVVIGSPKKCSCIPTANGCFIFTDLGSIESGSADTGIPFVDGIAAAAQAHNQNPTSSGVGIPQSAADKYYQTFHSDMSKDVTQVLKLCIDDLRMSYAESSNAIIAEVLSRVEILDDEGGGGEVSPSKMRASGVGAERGARLLPLAVGANDKHATTIVMDYATFVRRQKNVNMYCFEKDMKVHSLLAKWLQQCLHDDAGRHMHEVARQHLNFIEPSR
jgi:hypothetical protein